MHEIVIVELRATLVVIESPIENFDLHTKLAVPIQF